MMDKIELTLIDLIFQDFETYPNISLVEFQDEAFYKLGRDFTLSFEYGKNRKQYILQIGQNAFGIKVEELYTIAYGRCYKISSNEKLKGGFSIDINFGNDTAIPYLYITSEENAYGILDLNWKNGGETKFYFYNLLGFSGLFNIYKLRGKQTKYLSKCSLDNNYNQCYVESVLNGNYSCPNLCLPMSLPKIKSAKYFPRCQTWEDHKCMKNEVYDLLLSYTEEKCPMACKVMEYPGRLEHAINRVQDTFSWQYDISTFMDVREEYLIYDFSGFISSVGGMIGLFVGFSFLDLVVQILNYLKLNVSYRLLNSIYPLLLLLVQTGQM